MIWLLIIGFGLLYSISEHRRDVAETRLRSLNAEREPREHLL